ncbi:hypothetical protein [Maribacter aurantiacus]|uniref:Uncharacterized protein n=1 Tax=Maribacter aurantiacus TaxID=1882343 RepID=A0A5R8MBS7_9FLAO|nr:hypothetical protein [Maribacter aurantiacus]TLF47021.1 hypothetical protein FEK29_04440 [Maribacter aurantiacus]
MEEEIKVDEKFKSAFNLGYRLAEELNLKIPLIQNQEKIMPDNPMHLGMQQYIEEAKLLKDKKKGISNEKSETNVSRNENLKSRGKGLGY